MAVKDAIQGILLIFVLTSLVLLQGCCECDTDEATKCEEQYYFKDSVNPNADGFDPSKDCSPMQKFSECLDELCCCNYQIEGTYTLIRDILKKWQDEHGCALRCTDFEND
mmetsp:Transcript_97063/g.182564  ORF Transcript_97063/g.182564 Transcript_97063/m.182564 type:complete len:110 (+) Transcript_97063:70-399(+)